MSSEKSLQPLKVNSMVLIGGWHSTQISFSSSPTQPAKTIALATNPRFVCPAFTLGKQNQNQQTPGMKKIKDFLCIFLLFRRPTHFISKRGSHYSVLLISIRAPLFQTDAVYPKGCCQGNAETGGEERDSMTTDFSTPRHLFSVCISYR